MGGATGCLERDHGEYDRDVTRDEFQGRFGRCLAELGRTCGCWEDVLESKDSSLGRPEVWRPSAQARQVDAPAHAQRAWSLRTRDASSAYMERSSERLTFGSRA
ncbi:unnamed protein product [Durusdinium trenchii]|uniref:Uncharacterized protein n=1 Tax=Durusdinium trenchii TaxID=1381693 RepID=A0ABP0N544_9DINO